MKPHRYAGLHRLQHTALAIALAALSATSLAQGITISSTLPNDMDIKQKKALEAAGNFAGVQRMFDQLSWQSFVALNWPVVDGKPAPTITGTGDLRPALSNVDVHPYSRAQTMETFSQSLCQCTPRSHYVTSSGYDH